MVQAQIRNLRLQDEQIKGLSEEVIWAVGHASLDGAPMQTDTFQSRQSLSWHGLCHERNYVPLRHECLRTKLEYIPACVETCLFAALSLGALQQQMVEIVVRQQHTERVLQQTAGALQQSQQRQAAAAVAGRKSPGPTLRRTTPCLTSLLSEKCVVPLLPSKQNLWHQVAGHETAS